jgi:thiamine pyrophosphokinase
LPAGGQDVKLTRRSKQTVGQLGDRSDHVLAIIEHQEQLSVAEMIGKDLGCGAG